MDFLSNLLVKYLRQGADDIEKNRCELTHEQKEQLLSIIGKQPMSKTQAFKFLGISRSKFDYLLRCDRIPQGRKRFGFNELVWYKDELEIYKKEMEENADEFKMTKE